ncbi:MAG TPA: DNA translocase FtsK, partial [Azospirillaceae bacterium]|nr:DNA translocase FtsK [Azospirillaceae bacterium]
MNPSSYRPAQTDKAHIQTADEFNLWCALNNQPYSLIQQVWHDGAVEWSLERHSGTPEACIAYATGQEDETMAVITAFAFLAGVEWAIEADLPPVILPDDGESDEDADDELLDEELDDGALDSEAPWVVPVVTPASVWAPPSRTAATSGEGYSLPGLTLLQPAPPHPEQTHDEVLLARNARNLETVLRNFRIRGEIMEVRPGPVVTLYELEPAPGTKSS